MGLPMAIGIGGVRPHVFFNQQATIAKQISEKV
jgi:hypothetical protein